MRAEKEAGCVTRRSAYLAGVVSHDEYYAQFVTPETVAYVTPLIGIAKIRQCVEAGDTSLNGVSLVKVDRIAAVMPFASDKLKQAGETRTLSVLVCIAKRAALMGLEEYLAAGRVAQAALDAVTSFGFRAMRAYHSEGFVKVNYLKGDTLAIAYLDTDESGGDFHMEDPVTGEWGPLSAAKLEALLKHGPYQI